MNFETRQRCGTCPPSNRTKRGSRANCQCQRWEHLPALITKVAHTLGIPTPGDFHPDRSGGHVVPRWISPEVMVRVSFFASLLMPWHCKDLQNCTYYGFHVSIWGGLEHCLGALSPRNYPCGEGSGRMWDMNVNSSATINLIAQQLS